MADPAAAAAGAEPSAPPFAPAPAAAPPALSYPDQARAAGYSDDQINQWLAPWMADARAKGYSQDQINAHLGIVPPPAFDDGPVRSQISSNLAAAAKPVTSFGDALEAGWQLGNVGMGIRGAPPSKTVSPDAPWASRIAAQTAELAGDLPSMLGGFFVGAAGGAEGGPPGMAIGGTAGAMALPTALRELMMDSYAKGQFTNFRDFWSRVAPVMIDTAKSWVTGAATGAAGAGVGAAAGTVPGAIADWALPGSMQAAKTAAEVATMTTVGAAMEGHAPAAMDFANAAIVLGGVHFAGVGAVKLRDLYAQTGITPSAVVADAARDPTIAQDILSDKAIPDAYAAAGKAAATPEPEAARSAAGEDAGGQAPPGEAAATTSARTPFTPNFPDVVIQRPYGSPVRYIGHPDYAAAKAGDPEAADRFVDDMVDPAKVSELRAAIGDSKPTVVAVHAEEAAGRNAIPETYAKKLSGDLGLPLDDGIVQANKPQRTGQSAEYRISVHSEFDGPVEPGRDYLIVDDNVTQGGTLADLRSYIESRGGRVVAASTLTGSRQSEILAPRAGTIAALREKFPDLESRWQGTFGHDLSGLTESEAGYLLRSPTADARGDRVIARGQAGTASQIRRNPRPQGGGEGYDGEDDDGEPRGGDGGGGVTQPPGSGGPGPAGGGMGAAAEVLGKGDLWRLPPEQLDAMLEEKGASNHDKLVRALGSEEAAAEFNRLDRKQNSSIGSRADEGAREFDAKFGNLTPEQERLIYGFGETDAAADDIKAVLDAHGNRSDDPTDAAYEAAIAIRRVPAADIMAVPEGHSTATAQAAYVRLSNAYEDMRAAGIPGDQIGHAIAGALVNRGGWSPGDAAEVVGSFMERVAASQPAAPRAPQAMLPAPASEGVAPAAVSVTTHEVLDRPTSRPDEAPTAGGVGGAPGAPGTQGLLPLPEPGAGPPATLADAQNRILAHISIGEQPPARGWSWRGLYTNLVDRLYPLAAAVKSASGGEGLPAAQNAYKLARLMSGVAGKADRMLNGAGTFDFNSYQDTGPSLKAILAPVADDLDGFRAYLTSARAIELEGRGIATGFDMPSAQRVVAESADRYAEHAANLFGFQDRVSQYLRDSGVLSASGYAAMREANQLYVPFQRVMDDVDGLGIKLAGGGSLQARNPIHAIQGSQRVVIDPLESIIRNTFLFTQMAERNAVGTQMADMLLRSSAHEAAPAETPAASAAEVAALRDAGVAHPEDLEPMIAGAAPPREGEIRIFRDGKPETYQVDADLARAVKGLDGDTMSNLERMLRPFASALRAGAVLQPDFVLRHSLRDFLYAAVTSPSGLFTPVDMARGFLGLARQDADYQEWLKTGGAQVSMVALDRRYLQHSIDDLAGTGLLERAWNVMQDPDASTAAKARAVGMTLPADVARKFLISPMQAAVTFAESASHLGVFKQQLRSMEAGQEGGAPLSKAQLQEAGFVSRDTAVDASRMGAKMRTWNAVAAFSNIAIQDSDRVIRAFRESPMSTAIKVAGAISLPSALTWWNGHGDSRYDDAPNWERDLFWVIPTDRWQDISSEDYAKQTGSGRPADQLRVVDGQYQANNGITVRIPKPWGMGLVFGSGVERTLDAFVAHKPDAYAEFAKSMGQVSVPNLLPNALVPMMEQFANRSTFTNRTLVPDEMEKWLPEYQYTPYTTQTARALGQALGAFPGIKDARLDQGGMGGVARALTSPILLENYLRGWTGNLGMYALQLADAGLRNAGIVPDPPMPASTLADIPIVKAFVVRYPSSSAQSIQDFEDQYAGNKVFLDTWRAMARNGDAGAMARISAGAPPAAQADMSGANAQLLRLGVTPPGADKRTMGSLSSQQTRATTDVETQSQLAGMQVAAIRAKATGFGSQVTVSQLDDIHQAIGENSQLVRDISKNPNIPPDEKRQLIDTAYWRMAELAQIGKASLAQALGSPTAPGALH
jgi:hypothetical protein